ncbi:MAG: transposase [Candidatus Heimdallarchaeota archaeon]|nr:transposase [Candidatus Heimdallarchaeota archaeon]
MNELISKLIFFGCRRIGKRQFRELSDDEWALIQPVLPPKAPTGRPRARMIGRPSTGSCMYSLRGAAGWTCRGEVWLPQDLLAAVGAVDRAGGLGAGPRAVTH